MDPKQIVAAACSSPAAAPIRTELDTDVVLPIWSRRIKELRVAKGWNQQELADRSTDGKVGEGLALGTISAIERGGHTGTETLEKIANALTVPLGLLFLEDGEGHLTPAQSAELVSRLTRCAAEALEEFQKAR